MKKITILLIIILLSINAFAQYHGTKDEFKNKIPKKVQIQTNGIYIDKDKVYHDWSIKSNHTLVWNQKDFKPCGFKICFKSLEDSTTTELLQEDINTINELSAREINDIIISNNNQLTLSNPKVLNQIIELLDSKNMTYGIDLSEESVNPLRGYLINPGRYRIDGPYPETEIISMWPEVDSGIFIVVDKSTGEIIEKSAISKSNNGQIIIKLNHSLNENEALIFYPHMTYFTNYDLWQGYNEIRDNIIKYFGQIQLGKGFRFFYNPFNLDKFTSIVDKDDFIPNSSGYNLAFENYLTNAYGHYGSLGNSWAMNFAAEEFSDINDFLKLFPMWNNSRGVEYMYSLVTGDYIKIDPNYSTYWTDVKLSKLLSIQNYMNSISTCLKDNVANVPVIFSSSIATQTYTISFNKGTCDGFSSYFDLLDTEDCRNMALLYTYTESSPKTSLLFAVSQKPSMNSEDMEFLEYSGYRGFYFNYNNNDIPIIKDLKEKLTDYTPVGIAYPNTLPIKPQLLDEEALWYPSNDTFFIKKFGENIFAYQKEKDTNCVFFTLSGKRKITVVGKDENDSKIIYPINAKIQKGKSVLNSKEYTFEISEKPTLVSNMDINKLCPKEAALDAINIYESFTKEENFDKSFKSLMKENLKNIKNVYNHASYLNAYGMANEFINRFLYMIHADIWVEAEYLKNHCFNRVEVSNNASQHQYLLLDTTETPKIGNYYAAITLSIPENDSYDMWCLVSKEEISSPFSISNDNDPWYPVNYHETVPYTDDMVWVKAGTLNFAAGNHTINIKITDMNKSSLKYYLALDCILLTTNSKPKGIEKPKYVLNF